MEAHRLGYVKILKKVIIDSNILMQSIKYGINIKQAVEDALIMRCEIYVPEIVVKELKRKARHCKFLEKKLAEKALQVIQEQKINILKHEIPEHVKTDDIILSLTSRERGILITNDRELRRKARRLNIPVGFLNIEEKRVIVEYFP